MIVITGHIRIAPEKLEAARPHAKKNLEAKKIKAEFNRKKQ